MWGNLIYLTGRNDTEHEGNSGVHNLSQCLNSVKALKQHKSSLETVAHER